VGEPVFSGTPGTWKDRDQRDDRGRTSEVSYRVWEWHPIVRWRMAVGSTAMLSQLVSALPGSANEKVRSLPFPEGAGWRGGMVRGSGFALVHRNGLLEDRPLAGRGWTSQWLIVRAARDGSSGIRRGRGQDV